MLPGRPGGLEGAWCGLCTSASASDVLLSLMNQYTPVIAQAAAGRRQARPRRPDGEPRACDHVPDSEYEQLLDFADALGVEDYFWQEGGAAEESFIPAFDLTGVDDR